MSRVRFLISVVIAVASLIGIILGTLGIAVLFAVDLPGLGTLTVDARQSFAVWCFVALLVSWILFFIERRAMVGGLQIRLNRKRDLQAALDGLADLRSEGVNTLFARTPSADEFDAWVARFHNWEDRVIEYMKPRFTGAIVSLFSELGAVPAIIFSHASTDPTIAGKHEKYLRMIAKELTIIEKIIQQGSLLVQEPNPTVWEILWQRYESD